ncbi:hypothetical protein PUN28_004066 [Cardiocondyla obscurior]|uniref:Uncharacterized protein n=1 Tax=Cardiocondyla obscurior TaxID=286306 RepID=A0AAW2GLK4_9HYME
MKTPLRVHEKSTPPVILWSRLEKSVARRNYFRRSIPIISQTHENYNPPRIASR